MTVIGNGVLHLGDCLDVLAAMPAESVDLLVSDPPYRVISGGIKSTLANGYRGSVLSANDGKIFKHNNITFDEFMPEFFRVLKPGSHAYVMVNRINLVAAITAAERAGFHFHNLLRWDKNTFNANRWYMLDCEYTLFLAKRPVKQINDMSSKQGFAAPNPRNKVHPTEKPIELFAHYILNSSEPGDLVIDPFIGGGSLALAAEQTGRRWIGIELDPEYWLTALDRIDHAVNSR